MDFATPERLTPLLQKLERFVAQHVLPIKPLLAERRSFRAVLPELAAARATAGFSQRG